MPRWEIKGFMKGRAQIVCGTKGRKKIRMLTEREGNERRYLSAIRTKWQMRFLKPALI